MNKERLDQYDNLYMTMASEASKMSHAIRSQVGCIIIKDDNIISYGYNGMPSGMENECEYLDENGVLITKKEVLHAESNALLKAASQMTSTEDATLYVTMSPCFDCAKNIIQAKIKRVVYKEEYRNTDGIELLKSVKIIVQKI